MHEIIHPSTIIGFIQLWLVNPVKSESTFDLSAHFPPSPFESAYYSTFDELTLRSSFAL